MFLAKSETRNLVNTKFTSLHFDNWYVSWGKKIVTYAEYLQPINLEQQKLLCNNMNLRWRCSLHCSDRHTIIKNSITVTTNPAIPATPQNDGFPFTRCNGLSVVNIEMAVVGLL